MKDRQRKLIIIMETCGSEILTEYCCEYYSDYCDEFDFEDLKAPKKIYDKNYKEEVLLEYDNYSKQYNATFSIEPLDSSRYEFSHLYFLECEENIRVYFRTNKNNKLYMNVNGEYYFIVEFEREGDKTSFVVIQVEKNEIETVNEEFIERFL